MKSKLDEAHGCMSTALRKAARNITRVYDAAMRRHGLRSTQFALLVALDSTGPIAVSALAKLMLIERTTLTRNLVVLENEGFVRTTTGKDRRERVLAITPRGRIAAVRALPAWRKAQAQLQKRLGSARFAELARRLRDLTSV